MKVLLKKTISKLGIIGDVVEVKPGYARNYLLPQGLATQPTPGNLKAIEAEKQRYLEELAKRKAELQAVADAVNGKEVTIAARANQEGHLYGSVGPAQIVAALAESGPAIDPEFIDLEHPIRQLDKYDVPVRFADDVTASITVWVVPTHDSDVPAEPGAAETELEAEPAEEQE